jgi:hypothetical protein
VHCGPTDYFLELFLTLHYFDKIMPPLQMTINDHSNSALLFLGPPESGNNLPGSQDKNSEESVKPRVWVIIKVYPKLIIRTPILVIHRVW